MYNWKPDDVKGFGLQGVTIAKQKPKDDDTPREKFEKPVRDWSEGRLLKPLPSHLRMDGELRELSAIIQRYTSFHFLKLMAEGIYFQKIPM